MAKTLVYQLYPNAWEGGLKAMTEHLPIINQLDADYVWLSPIYPSPGFDHGYDISNYTGIDSKFGTLEDFDKFVKVAHSFGIGVIMDLVLNHTSIEHPWFTEHPQYYCRANEDNLHNWHNLFDDSSDVWEFFPAKKPYAFGDPVGDYYLHLFHKNQADLNWFSQYDDQINKALVREFRNIVEFWTKKYQVDGFRLDAIQALNKNLNNPDLQLSDLIFGSRAAEIINSIFATSENEPFLMLECIDPTYGGLTEFYFGNTPAQFVLNIDIKDIIDKSDRQELQKILRAASADVGFMLDLESHDSPRFPSRGIEPKDAIDLLFSSDPEGICLYQGQELGLKNPTKVELPDEKMLALDAQTAMLAAKGEDLDALRPHSRANARVPLPLEEYIKQENDPHSMFNYTKSWVESWKR